MTSALPSIACGIVALLFLANAIRLQSRILLATFSRATCPAQAIDVLINAELAVLLHVAALILAK